MRGTMAKGSELPGHEGKRRGRHCTGTGHGAAQSQGSALHKKKQRALLRLSVARSPPVALRGETPAALHGQCNAMRALETAKPSMFAAGDFHHFFATHRRDSRSLARFDCAD